MTDNHATLRGIFDDHLEVARQSRATLIDDVAALAGAITSALARGGKLITFGNGGSAADAQHFAAELTGHFLADRGALAAISLTTDTSALTAIGNDYSFDDVFGRPAAALCRPEDVVVGLSASGNSENVMRGIRAAKECGAETWALTGGTGGRLKATADHAIVVPSGTTARIQEMHITIIHAVCVLIDEWAAAR